MGQIEKAEENDRFFVELRCRKFFYIISKHDYMPKKRIFNDGSLPNEFASSNTNSQIKLSTIKHTPVYHLNESVLPNIRLESNREAFCA